MSGYLSLWYLPTRYLSIGHGETVLFRTPSRRGDNAADDIRQHR
jgi:hypothetical protein